MKFISHPLIKPESIESREYQLSIAMKALDANTMVILPTGLGKTAVALIVAASRLYNEGGRILMLAPQNLLSNSTSASLNGTSLLKAKRIRLYPRLSCSQEKHHRMNGLPTGNGQP